MSGPDVNVRAISIPTHHMCSNAGNKESATGHTSGRKLPLRGIQAHSGWSIDS
jgi:hypothetical protein